MIFATILLILMNPLLYECHLHSLPNSFLRSSISPLTEFFQLYFTYSLSELNTKIGCCFVLFAYFMYSS